MTKKIAILCKSWGGEHGERKYTVLRLTQLNKSPLAPDDLRPIDEFELQVQGEESRRLIGGVSEGDLPAGLFERLRRNIYAVEIEVPGDPQEQES